MKKLKSNQPTTELQQIRTHHAGETHLQLSSLQRIRTHRRTDETVILTELLLEVVCRQIYNIIGKSKNKARRRVRSRERLTAGNLSRGRSTMNDEAVITKRALTTANHRCVQKRSMHASLTQCKKFYTHRMTVYVSMFNM